MPDSVFDDLAEITTLADGDIFAVSLAGASGSRKITAASLGEALGGGGGVVDPVPDIFGDPDTAFEFDSSSLTGLTALSNTPDVINADTTVPDHLYLLDDATGETIVGRYATAPSAPWTAISCMTDDSVNKVYNMAGMFIGVSTPGAMDFWTKHYNANWWTTLFACPNPNDVTTPAASEVNNIITSIKYFAIRVNSATSVDYLWSRDGRIWTKQVSARNPGFTIATVGLALCAISASGCAVAWDYLRIWNSALTFPGVP